MTEIENPQNERTTFEYDLAGRRLKIERDNGIDTTLAYDDASQLTDITHRRTSTGATITNYDYTYNSAGIRTKLVDMASGSTLTAPSWEWSYDDAYRLTAERRYDGVTLVYADTFTYDDVGNRTLLHNAAGRTTYTYDAANQLETAVLGTTRTTYTYDDNGNLEVERTDSDRTTHTWDDENRLVQVEFPGGSPTTNEYTFNGDGQRVEIVDSQGTKKPIWDFENILLETDGSNATQVVYTLEPAGFGNLLSQRRGSTTRFYLFDALGSTRKLVNSSGTVTDSYDFRAYGETYSSSGSTVNVFRWVGQLGYYYDIDRLAYYLRARPYNPTIARFLSTDPLGNHYQYASSAPVIGIDPSGLMTISLARPIRPIPCGGYRISTITYTANFRAGVTQLIYIQKICVLARGYTQDCAPGPIGNTDDLCCYPLPPRKRCSPCCYLELIGGGPVENNQFMSARDENVVSAYSGWDCKSRGRYAVTAEVKAFDANKSPQLVLDVAKWKAGEEECNANCRSLKRGKLSPHIVIAGNRLPAWWNNQNAIVDSGTFTTYTSWNCCSRLGNSQTVDLPDGRHRMVWNDPPGSAEIIPRP